MARTASRHPTELELEILKILWREGPLPPREVRDRLVDFRDLACTSVITIMNIMVGKGYVRRRKTGPGYVYAPRISAAATRRSMLRDLVDRAFDGSVAAAMVNLIEEADLDADKVREMRALLKAKAEEGRG